MKAIQIISLVLVIGFTSNISAAPAPKPPPGPTDVNVVNDTSNPVPVIVQNPSGERQFVGFSDVTVNGGAGWPAVNAACTSKFGNGARVCAAYEIYNNGGPVIPMSPVSTKGWVINSPLNKTDFRVGDTCSAFKYSDPDHHGWVIDSDTGEIKYTTFSTENRFFTIGSCQSDFPVACCQ